MTPETERHIRSLAANKHDLEQRIRLLLGTDTSGKSIEEQHLLAGDLAAAQRMLCEVRDELLSFTQSTREIGP